MSKKKTAEQLQMEADKLAEQLKKARAEAKKKQNAWKMLKGQELNWKSGNKKHWN